MLWADSSSTHTSTRAVLSSAGDTVQRRFVNWLDRLEMQWFFSDLHSQHGCEQNAHLCIRESGWNVRWRGEWNRLSGLLQVGYFKVYRQRRPMLIFIRWPHDWTPIPVHTVDVDQDYVRQSIQSIQFICNLHPSKLGIPKYYLICEKFAIPHFYVFTKFIILDRECVCALSPSRRALQAGHFLARI